MSFETHKLNEQGFEEIKHMKKKIVGIRDFVIEQYPESRDRAIFITKLEEASFWAAKVVASEPSNHNEVIKY